MIQGYSFRPPTDIRQRCRLYILDGESFLVYLRGWTNHWLRLNFATEEKDFPRDADIRGVFWDFNRQAFLLLVVHASFDDVPTGEEFPIAGRMSVSVTPNPGTEAMSKELDAAAAIIHDLREQLAGRGS